ncbi:MAG TPA: hypothetical protein VEL51_14355 [Vicinamibacterales bacterium]|nr:hypothetical protein [Vicinamibacterales bacterium]
MRCTRRLAYRERPAMAGAIMSQHGEFQQPEHPATSGSFGLITKTQVPSRIIQLGMKFYF